MPTDVKQLVASAGTPSWTKWILFAVAVLVAKRVIKTGSELIATGADFSPTQRGALRDLFRM